MHENQQDEEATDKERLTLKYEMKEESETSEIFRSAKIPYIDIYDVKEIINGRVICFDVETTGFSIEDGIIEIGAVEVIDGYRTGALFQSYIKPQKQIHFKATKVHGLTNEKLSTAPPVTFVLASFLSWIGECPLISHNARYDMRMLLQELQKLNLADRISNRKVFCTMMHYRKLYPSRSAGLTDIVAHLGITSIDYKTNHTALADAETLSSILIKFFQSK